jgi:hypothetical protein
MARSLSTKIVRLVAANPRKNGTQGHAAWNVLTDEMTLGEYLKAVAALPGKINPREHLDWDRAHGWVRFEDETPEEAAKPNAAWKGKKGAVAPAAPTPSAFDIAIAETLAANAAEAEAPKVEEVEAPAPKKGKKAA